MDPYLELRDAVTRNDDDPTPESRTEIVRAAQRFVSSVEQRASVIEYMRQRVTPSQQALAEIMGGL